MTAICAGGGPSGPKPGQANVQVFAASELVDFLAMNRMTWPAALMVGIAMMSFDLPTFCATDPPALPPVDAGRIAGYFNPLNPQGAAELRQDWFDLVGHFMWYSLCQCESGAQPPPPPPMPAPVNVVINPPALTPPSGPCGTQQVHESWILPPNTPTTPGTIYPLVGNPNKVTVSGLSSTSGSGNAHTQLSLLRANNSTSGNITIANLTGPSNAGDPLVVENLHAYIQDGATAWSIAAVYTATSGSGTAAIGFNGSAVFEECTTPPEVSPAPCCVTDPVLEQLLGQILSVQAGILSLLEPLTGYADATRHAGLSGTGSVILVNDCPAIRVEIRNLPPTWANNPGTPSYFFSVGFITSYIETSPLKGWRLVYPTQTFPLAALVDQIGYTLYGDLVVDIVELVKVSAT